MTVITELFEKRYIDRDLILLDSACFNHLFNSKKWFVEYEDIKPFSTSASNGGNSSVISRGTVRIPFLLPNRYINTIDLPNSFY